MTRDCRGPPKLRHYVLCQYNPIGGSLVGGEEWLVRADSCHNDGQRACAKTRGRSRELIAGGRHECEIVLALSNDRMFLAAATVGCRPSACASPAIPKQVGHNHL